MMDTQAGSVVTVIVQVKDKYGNDSELNGACQVMVHGTVQQMLELGGSKPKKTVCLLFLGFYGLGFCLSPKP